MAVRNKASMLIGLFGGILLVISGFSAVTYLEKIRSFVVQFVKNETIELLFFILILCAGFSGILVIIGSALIGAEKVRIGKILITIGICIGPIGLFITLLLISVKWAGNIFTYSMLGICGIVLAIVAKYLCKA